MEQAKAIVLSALLLFNTPVYAECSDVSPIKKGDVAACDGFLFSKDAERQAEEYRSDSQYYKSLSEKYAQKAELEASQNTILEKRLNLYITSINDLSKEVAKRDNSESLYRTVYFVLGVLVTGLAVRNLRP